MALKEIKTYDLSIWAGPKTANMRSSIHLYDEKGTIGVLAFVEDGPIPASVVTGTPIGYYPVARYADAVDMLRNEKPVYLVVNGDDVQLSTAQEPAGEGEAKTSAFAPFKVQL